jgi:phosphate transport system substrate-binding protein
VLELYAVGVRCNYFLNLRRQLLFLKELSELADEALVAFCGLEAAIQLTDSIANLFAFEPDGARRACGGLHFMQRRAKDGHLRVLWPAAVLVLAQAVVSQNPEKINLVGVGSTSALSFYSWLFQEFEKTRTDLHFSYIPSGSRTGIDMVTSGSADFGGTDVPLTDKQLARAQAVQIATGLVAIVPVYNVPNVTQPLNFTPQALAGIYLGTITRWDDPEISGPNPEIRLPSSSIAVIHSANGRGSTYIWSDYLSKVNMDWRTRIGGRMSIRWPVGAEAEGNGNVAKIVKGTQNSIGNVELGYAMKNRLQYGRVRNAAGNFILPDSRSIMAAATSVGDDKPTEFRASITNPPGDSSYPISSFTWILVSENMQSQTKQEAVKDFLRWLLQEGQTHAQSAGLTRLPQATVEYELKAVEKIP